MLINYIKIAFRNLWKHKVDSAISIGGLAVGIACCILLMLYVRFEWSYDSFHEDSERIYRVTKETTNPNNKEIYKTASNSHLLASTLKEAYPEVVSAIRISTLPLQLRAGNTFNREDALFADAGFFSLFNFPLIAGDANTVLANPDHMVISEGMAERLFGRDQAIGKEIVVRIGSDEHIFRVSGIAGPIPKNSSIQFDIVIPFDNYSIPEGGQRAWYIDVGETWLLLNPGASAKQLEEKLPSFISTNYVDRTAEILQMKLQLQTLNEVYFEEEIHSFVSKQGNVLYTWILAGIALAVLAIASINFMSLTLSRASGRSGEIGIRKVMGATRTQLAGQFLGEAFLICGIAFLLGIVLAELFIPFFQQILQKPVTLALLGDPELWGVLAGLILFTTLITGGYPAFVISRERATGLFSLRTASAKMPGIIKGLIAAQFALAVSFLAITMIMQQQLQYMLNRDLGFTPENVIMVELDPFLCEGIYELYKPEALNLAGVDIISGTRGTYGGVSGGSFTTLDGLNGQIDIFVADEHFVEAMGIEMTSGRFFSPDHASEMKEGIVVNQRFADVMGWDDAVGQIINDGDNLALSNKRVIGVMDDYHFRSLFHNLEPVVFRHPSANDASINTMLIKTADGMTGQTLQQLSALWNEMFPTETFNYSFLDDVVRRQYMKEERWSRIMYSSTSITILLACFGLFGIAALAAQRRTKEIGIRKVMGASSLGIVTLLNKDFLKLVITGFVFAVPIAWYTMNRWLENFAYRIEMGPGMFLIAGVLAVFIAMITVSWQSVRTALMNPADSLRDE